VFSAKYQKTAKRVDIKNLYPLYVDDIGYRSVENLPGTVVSKAFLAESFEQIELLNRDYFSRITLTHPDRRILEIVYLSRKFKSGGGGRYFQRGGLSYQNIKRAERKRLLINGKSVSEVDFGSIHIYILYHKRGYSPPDDPYQMVVEELVGREDADVRSAVKNCFFIAINAGNEEAYKDACRDFRDKDIWKAYYTLVSMNLDPEAVLAAIKKIHPHIAQDLHSNRSLDWMFAESMVITNVLLRLMDLGIPAVPLHDSLICQKQNMFEVVSVMRDEYQDYMGWGISVKEE